MPTVPSTASPRSPPQILDTMPVQRTEVKGSPGELVRYHAGLQSASPRAALNTSNNARVGGSFPPSHLHALAADWTTGTLPRTIGASPTRESKPMGQRAALGR